MYKNPREFCEVGVYYIYAIKAYKSGISAKYFYVWVFCFVF